MNELVKQMLEFAQKGSTEGVCMFLIVMGAMYCTSQTIVYIFRWIAIAIKGHPPVNSKLCSECKEEIEED